MLLFMYSDVFFCFVKKISELAFAVSSIRQNIKYNFSAFFVIFVYIRNILGIGKPYSYYA